MTWGLQGLPAPDLLFSADDHRLLGGEGWRLKVPKVLLGGLPAVHPKNLRRGLMSSAPPSFTLCTFLRAWPCSLLPRGLFLVH